MELRTPEFTDIDRGSFCCTPDCGRSFANGDVIYNVEWTYDDGDYMSAYTHTCGAHLPDAVPDGREITWVYPIQEPQIQHIDVLFDGPPGHTPGRFVDVVHQRPHSGTQVGVKAGEWVERDDGYWALRLPVNAGWLVG